MQRLKSLLVLCVLALSASPLRAFDYTGRWGVTLSGGYDNAAMGDVNRELSNAGGNLSNGYEGNLSLSYGFTPGILMNLAIGELYNSNTFTGGSISLPALSFQLGEQYVAWTAGAFDVSVYGALEYDALDGDTYIDPNTFKGTASIRRSQSWGGGGGPPPGGGTYIHTNCVGSTLGAQISLKGTYFFTNHWAAGLDLGYRLSHIYEVTGTTNNVTGPESETVDYSGFLSKLSASYYF